MHCMVALAWQESAVPGISLGKDQNLKYGFAECVSVSQHLSQKLCQMTKSQDC